VGLAALAIGGCAAFFSVYGISQLFAGAFTAVVIMASSLEFGKLVLASHLQRYWKKINKIRRTYLSTLVIFLMIITSAGIYGLLSSAYQKTYTSYTIMDNEVSFLKQKEEFFQSDIDRYEKDIAQINDNIGTLSGAKVSSLQYKDKQSGEIINSISTTELRVAQARIATEEANKKELEAKRIVAIDSLNTYKTKILILQNNTDISGELGPLIYLKDLTGLPMDKVVNFFIILLVFVFDPLAIMLVLEANRIFEDKRNEREGKENKPSDTITLSTGEVFDVVKKNDAVNDAVKQEPKVSMLSSMSNLFSRKAKAPEPEVNVESEVRIEPPKTVATPIGARTVLQSGFSTAIPEPKITEAESAPEPEPASQPKPEVAKTQITSVKPDGISDEDINKIRQNQNRNFSRSIPARRGY